MRSNTNTIHFDLILPHMKAISRKQAFQVIAREAAPISGLGEEEIYNALEENASQGRSGIGDGVAIPHARLEKISKPCIVFARLGTAIEYGTLDGAPVDLICAILAPASENIANLQRLALISRAFRNETIRERLRDASSVDAIKIAFLESENLMKAA